MFPNWLSNNSASLRLCVYSSFHSFYERKYQVFLQLFSHQREYQALMKHKWDQRRQGGTGTDVLTLKFCSTQMISHVCFCFVKRGKKKQHFLSVGPSVHSVVWFYSDAECQTAEQAVRAHVCLKVKDICMTHKGCTLWFIGIFKCIPNEKRNKCWELNYKSAHIFLSFTPSQLVCQS